MHPPKKKRASNIELYRIIAMFLIVAHHYVVNSGLREVLMDEPTSLKSLFMWIWGMWGKTGINCFVLITGYFMCKSQITLRKFLKLFLQIFFYNIVITAIFMIAGYEPISVKSIVKNAWPIMDIGKSFTSSYLLFYMFIPYLNILIANIERRSHGQLIMLCLLIYSLLGQVPFIDVRMSYVSWFCVLYFIASYIRLYGLYRDGDVAFWRNVTLISLGGVIVFTVAWLSLRTNVPYFFVSDSNKPLALLIAVSSFMFFKNLNLKYNNTVNLVAASTFGILLIHANSDIMRRWLWQDVFHNINAYYSDYVYLHAISVPLMVFTVCSLIEIVRLKVIEKPLLKIVYQFCRKYIPYE